jgi:hypothetical protein
MTTLNKARRGGWDTDREETKLKKKTKNKNLKRIICKRINSGLRM